jgi:hypothetical protein
MTKGYHLTRLLLVFLYPACGLAQETVNSYEPFNFPADQSSIVSRIEFPDYSKEVTLRVFCDVAVTKSGEFERSICWSDHEDGVRFVKAVEKNIDGTQLVPARVNGDAVDIWFQYTVQFEKRDDVENITLFPHQFVGITGPGTGYSSPQLYNTSIQTPGLRLECNGSYFIWYAILVPAEGGTPTKVQALNKSGSANCRRHSQAVAEKGLYIPAFLDGTPVEAGYKQIWSDEAWR